MRRSSPPRTNTASRWCSLGDGTFDTSNRNISVFTLDRVVPWGRSFDEYRRMFSLTDHDGQAKILGCGDGPASFNAEATRRGWRVVSCDPIYRFSVAEIRERIAKTYDEI